MKTPPWFCVWLLASVAPLSACASAAPSSQSTGGDAGSTSGGGSSSGGTADGGLQPPRVNDPCDPSAVLDACAPGGLVCDQLAARCRLPGSGEQCALATGCAAAPVGLGCYPSSVGSVCLVPCTSSDSSGCPYATSCGDPNLPGFCSAQGTPACLPWSRCTLGPGVSGDCVPVGVGVACLASGTVAMPYAACNPAAENAAASVLCRPGSVCQQVTLGVGSGLDGGFCFALCGDPRSGGCQADEHCEQPNTGAYGLCQPGLACALDADTCPVETVCVPDVASRLSGGCLPVASDAGGLGEGCRLGSAVALASTCSAGVCVQADGGERCAAPCDLADGGRPYCVRQTCTALNPSDASEVLGVCR